MSYLKNANLSDAKAEHDYFSQILADENGFSNPHEGVGFEAFCQVVLLEMLSHANGMALPKGYVPQNRCFLWEDDRVVGLFRRGIF